MIKNYQDPFPLLQLRLQNHFAPIVHPNPFEPVFSYFNERIFIYTYGGTADEHFAPKHILLLRNTLLLKSITHFAAQHTWQSHNLLFYTPCS